MRLYDIDLTEEEYYSYYIHEDDDNVDITFQDTEIMISSEAFNRLKEDILEQERLIKREDSTTIEMDGKFSSKREILLKELIKTIDKIDDLTREYDEKYMESIGDAGFLTPSEEVKLKKELYPLHKEKNRQIAYKQKLEAQLEYGDLK